MTNGEWLDYLAQNAPDELAAWFDAEHVETEERALDGDTAALEAEYGKGGFVGGSFIDIPEQGEVVMPLESWREYLDTEPENADSREKLEADVFKAAEDMEMFYNGERFIDTRKIFGWLDRQAAITEREVEYDLMKAGRIAVEVERERIKKLTAERDELKGQVFTLKVECDDLENELYKTKAERDEWKSRCEKGKAQFDAILAERELYREALSQLLDTFTDGMSKVSAILDNYDEGMA